MTAEQLSCAVRLTMGDGSLRIIPDVQKCEYIRMCEGCGRQFLTEDYRKVFCTEYHRHAHWKKNHNE